MFDDKHPLFNSYIKDTNAGDWHRPFENYCAGYQAALNAAEKVVLADAVKNPVTEYQRQYNITLQSTTGSIRKLIGKEST